MKSPAAVRGLLVILLGLLLGACGGGSGDRLQPPDIKYGEDISEMGMFVVDPRYTVATLPKDQDWLLFDDIGEFLRYRQIHTDVAFDIAWVPDFNDESWIKAEEAWYLKSPELTSSPMGWGVATFKDEESAKAAEAQYGGALMTWSEVGQQAWDAPPAPHEHD
jgi:hypothetical protein